MDVAAQRPDVRYAWEVGSNDSIYSAPGTASMTTQYNDGGQALEVTSSDSAGQVLSRVHFTYDAGGNLIEDRQQLASAAALGDMPDSLNPTQRDALLALFAPGRTHGYDEQGGRIETRAGIGPVFTECRTTAYNENGDPVEHVSENRHGEFRLDKEGRLRDTAAGRAY